MLGSLRGGGRKAPPVSASSRFLSARSTLLVGRDSAPRDLFRAKQEKSIRPNSRKNSVMASNGSGHPPQDPAVMTRNVFPFALSLAVASAYAGCAITVIDQGTTSSSGGEGGSTSAGSASSSSAAGGPSFPSCVSPDAHTCSCQKGDLHIACSVKSDELECVCSYGSEFSGICFETNPKERCNFEKGCCANYFSGQ
jgi:hypothetical protein